MLGLGCLLVFVVLHDLVRRIDDTMISGMLHAGFVHAMTLGDKNLITGCADRTIKVCCIKEEAIKSGQLCNTKLTRDYFIDMAINYSSQTAHF